MLRTRLTLAAVGAMLLVLACKLPFVPSTPEGEPSLPAEPTSASTATAMLPAGEGADLIFHNGHLITMNPEQPQAAAVAVRGGRILAVGTDEGVLGYRGADTQVIDLASRTLMPGIIDAHTHLFLTAPNQDMTYGEAQDLFLANGVTTISEMYADPDYLRSLQEFSERGRLKLRTSVYLTPYINNCGEVLDEAWYREYSQGEQLAPRLRIGGVKLYTDGGGCNAPAVSFEYEGGGRGDLYFTVEELAPVLARYRGEGYQLAIHAIGDRAIRVVQEALEATDGIGSGQRHRIEHNSVIPPELRPRYGELAITGVLFGGYPTCFVVQDRGPFRFATPDENLGWEWPWKELLAANPEGIFAYHSDALGNHSPNPFDHLYGMVTREQVAEDGTVCEPPESLAKSAISVEQTLEIMTLGGAYAVGREGELGSLEEGKLADLVILSANPFEVEPRSLDDIRPLMTMIGGRTEYCAQTGSGLCPEGGPTPAAVETEVLPARFEEDFDGPLDASWSWRREDPDRWSLNERPGWLTLWTTNTALLLPGADAPVLLDGPAPGDFEARAVLEFAPVQEFQSAGLVVYQDEDHLVTLGRTFCGSGSCVGDGVYLEGEPADAEDPAAVEAASGLPDGPIELRIRRVGDEFRGEWRELEGEWQRVGSRAADLSSPQVGIYASAGRQGAPSIPAHFDEFLIIRQ